MKQKFTLNCSVRCELPVRFLASQSPAFAPLRTAVPQLGLANRWQADGAERSSFEVLVLGKTGHGKSTLFSALLGFEIFESSDVEAGTREMQSAEFRFDTGHEHCTLSFADLPGIGESGMRDREYLRLYRAALEKAHALVYVLRADQRDFYIDEVAFSSLGLRGWEHRLTLALTCIDKMQPINRSEPFRLSNAQLANIEAKIDNVRDFFHLPQEQIVPVCAVEGIGLDALAVKIMEALKPCFRFPVD